MKKFGRTREHLAPLTDEEIDAVTVVFHQYETGLREGTIYTKDLLPAMKALGLSPTEQEVVDMQCEVESKGRIFFPDFCRLCLRKFREFNEEHFRQELFKNICGTEKHPVRFRAKKYKISEKFFSRSDFEYMMSRLPVYVSVEEINEMFAFADKDKDGKISYQEFLTMITPRPPDPSTNATNIKLNMTISGTSTMLPHPIHPIDTKEAALNNEKKEPIETDKEIFGEEEKPTEEERLIEPLITTTA